MKYLLVLALLNIFILGVIAQKNTFIIHGKITSGNFKKLFIEYRNINNILQSDSIYVNKNKFLIQGNIKEPVELLIKTNRESRNIDDVNLAEFYIEPTTMNLILQKNNFKKGILTNSYIQQCAIGLNRKTVPIESKIEKYKDSIKLVESFKQISDIKKRKLTSYYNSLIIINQNKITTLLLSYLKSNTHNYFSAFILKNNLYNFSTDTLEKYYSKLDPKIKQSFPAQIVSNYLAKEKAMIVGKIAPDFTTMFIDSTINNLSKICKENELVLIDFWASWCLPCRKSFNTIRKYHHELKPKGFEVVAISLDANKSLWHQAIEQDSIAAFKHTLINFNSNDVKKEDISKKYSFNGIPFYLLLDKNATILVTTDDINIVLNYLNDYYK